MANTEKDREKALDSALAQIERQFGKGSLMRLGDSERMPIEVIPTGSIALDIALGIGGLPRGRIVPSWPGLVIHPDCWLDFGHRLC
jgi:recombination protein RecA